jgi:uncharacterized protein (DUF305 family)
MTIRERPRRTALRHLASRRRLVAATLPALAVVISGKGAGAQADCAEPPDDHSADAGFARDMGVHHGQAVTMALPVLVRTDDPAMRVIATDILLTQQAQIGMMLGWLGSWGLPASGSDPAMAWMGHTMEMPMPGMASREEVASLETLPPAEMDRQFLRLMIPHHQGGVEMAAAAVDLCQRPEVIALANAIVKSQQAEITILQEMLQEREAASI